MVNTFLAVNTAPAKPLRDSPAGKHKRYCSCPSRSTETRFGLRGRAGRGVRAARAGRDSVGAGAWRAGRGGRWVERRARTSGAGPPDRAPHPPPRLDGFPGPRYTSIKFML